MANNVAKSFVLNSTIVTIRYYKIQVKLVLGKIYDIRVKQHMELNPI